MHCRDAGYTTDMCVNTLCYHAEMILYMHLGMELSITELYFTSDYYCNYLMKLNSLAFVRERTIQTERPSLVSKVSADFCG
jgi:hypothetical protein